MGSLYAALGLKPPKRMLVAASAEAREMALVDTGGGAAWDDREVDEAEIAAFMAGGKGAPKADAPAKAPEPAGRTFTMPVCLAAKLGKRFKYLDIEKLTIEGELTVVTAGAVGGAKPSPTNKIEVDLKTLLLTEASRDCHESKLDVDPVLECKLGAGQASVAIGVKVSSGWYTGALKFVAIGRDRNGRFEFANFQLSPFGVQFKDKPIDVGGVQGKVSGKLAVSIVVKPNWGAIGVDAATKIGRPVVTTIAEVLTAEAAIAAGFVAGAAAQVFAYVKTVAEWREVRDCAQAAENGWLSFRAGFGSVYGLAWEGGGAAALQQQGAAAAGGLLAARLKATRAQVQAERGALPANFDADYMATMKELAAKNPDGLGIWVQRNFRRQILEGFLRAYAQEHGEDTMYEQNARALRTLLGVGGG